jgi:hypothetical protein
MPQCVEIVQKIDTSLEGTKIHMDLFTLLISDSGREITQHMQRRLLFLCFIYSKIIYGTGNVKFVKFVHISKLPKFLLDISCCLDLQFNLEQFNANFGKIFNEELSEPAPEPAPTADEPQYISSVSQTVVSIIPQPYVSSDPPYILEEVEYNKEVNNKSPY